MTLRRTLVLTVVAALAAVVGLAAYGWANGVRFYAVESGSMAPSIGSGGLVIDEPVTSTTVLRVGDVITFHPVPGATTTHRIAAIDSAGVTTKGDANATADIRPIPPSSVVGRVLAVVPFVGSVADFFRRPAGVAALAVLLIALGLAWQLGAWFVHERRQKSGTQANGAAEPDAVAAGPGPGRGVEAPAHAGILGGLPASETDGGAP